MQEKYALKHKIMDVERPNVDEVRCAVFCVECVCFVSVLTHLCTCVLSDELRRKERAEAERKRAEEERQRLMEVRLIPCRVLCCYVLQLCDSVSPRVLLCGGLIN